MNDERKFCLKGVHHAVVGRHHLALLSFSEGDIQGVVQAAPRFRRDLNRAKGQRFVRRQHGSPGHQIDEVTLGVPDDDQLLPLGLGESACQFTGIMRRGDQTVNPLPILVSEPQRV